MKKTKNINGWIFLDKPIGISSNLALQKVRKIFNYCKAGYVGTLDPLASGFLPIALGNATKTIKYLDDSNKEYNFEVNWGLKTSSGDLEGNIEEITKNYPSREQILKIIPNFIGYFDQEPHKFSSKKINGIRAYKLARRKLEFKLEKKKIEILDLKLLNCLSETRAYFYVKCSSGCYVRRLAEDIAKTLGTFATVTALRRVGFRDFNKKLISLDYLLTLVHSDDLKHTLKPINLVFDNANEIILDENGAQHILNGRTVKIKTVIKSYEKKFTLAKFKNEVIAIGYLKDDSFYPKKLLSYL